MPSLTHEAVVELFRRRPTLAPELLRDELHVPMPPVDHVQVADSDVSAILPTERTADLVLLLFEAPAGPPRRALIVEVQLAIDPDKRRSWWWYLVGVHTRHQCDAALVVVTLDPVVASWASQPIALGHPGAVLRPLVVGPDAVPLVRDEASAQAVPELAVLSAIVHGHGQAARDIAKAALSAVARLDDERAALYTDVVLASLSAAARAILEDLMANGTYQYQSDFAKRYVAEGRAEGEIRGRAQGKAQAVLAVLEARGLEVPAAVRERVLGCEDLARLDGWVVRAVSAASAAEVVDGVQ